MAQVGALGGMDRMDWVSTLVQPLVMLVCHRLFCTCSQKITAKPTLNAFSLCRSE